MRCDNIYLRLVKFLFSLVIAYEIIMIVIRVAAVKTKGQSRISVFVLIVKLGGQGGDNERNHLKHIVYYLLEFAI